MSYAAVKQVHAATGVSSCASAFVTHTRPKDTPTDAASQSGGWGRGNAKDALPNLILVKASVLEIYNVRFQEGDEKSARGSEGLVGSACVAFPASAKRGGFMAGITAAWLELVCHYRLFGIVETMAILHHTRGRDSIILTFRDAKFSVLYFDDATQQLKTSSMHYFEGPEWVHLKRGRVKFPVGPLVHADSQGKCAAVLIYKSQLVVLKSTEESYSLGEKDESSTIANARIQSSYIINLEEVDMMHVKDFVFLDGYIEPVIAVLYEREPTWAGRIAYRRDTCNITALSINTNAKQHSKLWSQTGLPYDAYRLLAVPFPIGGVLVLCANSILYYSQVSTCMLALNDFVDPPAGSLDIPRSKVNIELDSAHATWLSCDVALFTTKTGMLLFLYLIRDGSTVQKLELLQSKGSVLSSCICTIGDKFFFIGSRLGESLLVQYKSATNSTSRSQDYGQYDEMDGDAQPSKRQRLDSDTDELSSYQYSSMDPDEAKNANFTFSVRDSLCNIGPIRDITCGPQIVQDQGGTRQELVACCGHGKNGSIAILSRSIHAETITEVELPGCIGVWTVHYKGDQMNTLEHPTLKEEKEEYHAYLIISLESRTMVLETGEQLGEVTESVEYFTTGPTISAGNLFGRSRIVQIYQKGLRVLDGARQTQDIPIEEPAEILSASFADPYIILQLADGSCRIATGDVESLSVSLFAPPELSSSDPITTCTLYNDKGAWLRRTSGDVWQTLGVPEPNITFDQGDTYCIVCRSSGNMEFYELPNMGCLYRVENITHGLHILVDCRVSTRVAAINTSLHTAEEDADDIRERMCKLKVVDVCMDSWGEKYGRPFFFVLLNDGTVLSYRAFCYEGQQEGGEGTLFRNLRFVRRHLDLEVGEEDMNGMKSVKKMICFKNVGGLQGIFLAGGKPTWVMIFREQLRLHPQASEGAVVAFTSLHNVNCPRGFIYVNDQGVLKLCRLSDILNYDNDWPVHKVPLKATPHQLAYHSDLNVYALVVSYPVSLPLSIVIPSIPDSSHQTEQTEVQSEADNLKFVQVDEFEVRILEHGTWQTLDTIKLHATENVLAVRFVNIKNVATEQIDNLLAIGTAYLQGEDIAARGRIILLSLGVEQHGPRISAREVYSKEQKGAISAIAALQGHLVVAIGTKILFHTWNGSELIGTAFFDAPLYVVSLNIVKNFILFGDFHKSIYFLHWKEDGAQLTLLAKDFESADCYATEFLIDGSTLSLLVSDARKNIQVFSYAPKSAESWKGQKLLPRIEFHLGSHVAKFVRMQMLPSEGTARSSRYALCFGTLDGGIGYVVPLDELTFRRLQTLQRKLVECVPQLAGLNPKSYRRLYTDGDYHKGGPDNSVDSEQLRLYEGLPLEQQMALAKQIGTTRQQILLNLRDLSQTTSFF